MVSGPISSPKSAIDGIVWIRLRIAKVRRAYFYGPLVYLTSTLVALVQPVIGLLINVSLWILWIRLGYREERAVQ